MFEHDFRSPFLVFLVSSLISIIFSSISLFFFAFPLSLALFACFALAVQGIDGVIGHHIPIFIKACFACRDVVEEVHFLVCIRVPTPIIAHVSFLLVSARFITFVWLVQVK